MNNINIRARLKKHLPSDEIRAFTQPIAQIDVQNAIPAAVLVTLQKKADGVHIMLTKRSSRLSDHAGQISFVGGICEKTDKDTQETALREAYEEVGLPSNKAEIIATLNPHFIARKFIVTPHVALIEDFKSKIDYDEVAELFTVPLEFFLMDKNCLTDNRHKGYYGKKFIYESFDIWGGTASILLNLKAVLLDDT